MKYCYFFLLVFTSLTFFSQTKFSKEISLITDNDLFVSIKNDRYYTSGIFLNYKYLSKKKNELLVKKIIEWKIGHEMFTPYKATVKSVLKHDRPFAAHLYGAFSINRVYKNNRILKTILQFGVLGKSAYGQELQDFIHDIYGFKKAVGWQHQIKNAVALNFNATYIKLITKKKTNSFDISWINKAKAGTIYTNIATGFYGRIAFNPLQKIANSIAFNTNLNNKNTNFKREIESFIYVNPMLRYAFFDGTLQGSFLNSKSEVTNKLVPLIFTLEIGLQFTANRFNFGYSYNYNTNKSKNLKYANGHKYGKIVISYLLK